MAYHPNNMRIARIFAVGLGLVLSFATTHLIFFQREQGEGDLWDIIFVLILGFGLGGGLVWLGLCGNDRQIVSIIGSLIEATPEDFKTQPEKVGLHQFRRGWAWILLYLVLYGVTYFSAVFGAGLLFDNGEIVWGLSLMAASLSCAGIMIFLFQ